MDFVRYKDSAVRDR